MRTAEPLAARPSAFQVQIVVENLKRHKSPGINHIPEKFIPARGRTIHSEVHNLIHSIWNKEELLNQWK
jgi:hypothetical protein